MTARGRVVRLTRFGLTVADLGRAEAFYRDGLGFARRGGPTRADAALLRLLGPAPCEAHTLTMRLGWQEIELDRVRPARPRLSGRRQRGEHRVPAFCHRRARHGSAPMRARPNRTGSPQSTTGGPQRLPPASGSVAAAKFRDPDGHPLELLEFPRGRGAARVARSGGVAARSASASTTPPLTSPTPRAARRFYTRLLGFLPVAVAHRQFRAAAAAPRRAGPRCRRRHRPATRGEAHPACRAARLPGTSRRRPADAAA